MGAVGNVIRKFTTGVGQNLTPVESADNQKYMDSINQLMAERDRISASNPGAAQNYSQGYGSLFDALGLQQAAAEGNAPSAAQGVLQQGLDTSIANQAALANSGPTANQVSRQKSAIDAGANLRQKASNDASILRANEMAAARGQYGQTSTGAANLGQQGALGFNAQQLDALKAIMGGQGTALGLDQGRLGQQGAQGAQALNGIGGGISSAVSFLASDEGQKTGINFDDKIKNFLDEISAASFDYKDPDSKNGKTPGEHIGVMAQDIEKAPGGKSMIVETTNGKMIDGPSALGTLLAAAAHLNKRVSEIEKKRGKKNGD